MVSAAYRGVAALFAAIAITSPAWGGFEKLSTWLEAIPQLGSEMVLVIAVIGVAVGLYASRRRREP